jgi:galactose mutarotase-like enzyme
MGIISKKIQLNQREITVFELTSKRFSIQVLPQQGFSLISFKCGDRELLDQWNLEEFVGTEEDLIHVSENLTRTFRKGYGPSIGPWFNLKETREMGFQHGICRFADWSRNVKTGDDFIRSRLNGKKERILGRKIDDICGFHFDVEIKYQLNDRGLVYSVENYARDIQGTFGIHWYLRNPADTKVMLSCYEYIVRGRNTTRPLDTNLFKIDRIKIVCDMNKEIDHIFENKPSGPGQVKHKIIYSDDKEIEFVFDQVFIYTTLFNTKGALCVEPVSDQPSTVGRFRKGSISINPLF